MPTYTIKGKRVTTSGMLSDDDIDEIAASIPDEVDHQALLAKAESDLAAEKQNQPFLSRHPNIEKILNPVFATGDVITSALSGAAATPVSGLVGIIARGITDSSGKPVIDPNFAKQKFMDASLYRPQTPEGQWLADKAGIPMRGFSSGLNAISDAISKRSPTAGKIADMAAGTLGDALAAYPLAKAVGEVRSGPKMQNQEPAQPEVIKNTRNAGIPMRPGDFEKAGGKAPVGKFMEKISDSSKLRRDLLEPTQARIDSLAKREIGIPESTVRLTEADFDKVRAPHNAVYDEVASSIDKVNPKGYAEAVTKAGNTMGESPEMTRAINKVKRDYIDISGKSPNDLIEYTKKLRRDATRDFIADNNSIGQTRLDISKAIENVIEQSSPEGMIGKFRDARKALAKINTVESATTAGRVDASAIKKLAAKDVPLTGNLKTIADTAEYFPHTTKSPSSMADLTPTHSATDVMVNVATLGTKPMAQAAIRKALASEWYQKKLVNQIPQSSIPAQPLDWSGNKMALGDISVPVPPTFQSGKFSFTDAPMSATRTANPSDFSTGGLALADELSLQNRIPIGESAPNIDTSGLSLVGDRLMLPPPSGIQARPQGWTGNTLLSDNAGIATEIARRNLGMTPDIVRAIEAQKAREAIAAALSKKGK